MDTTQQRCCFSTGDPDLETLMSTAIRFSGKTMCLLEVVQLGVVSADPDTTTVVPCPRSFSLSLLVPAALALVGLTPFTLPGSWESRCHPPTLQLCLTGLNSSQAWEMFPCLPHLSSPR